MKAFLYEDLTDVAGNKIAVFISIYITRKINKKIASAWKKKFLKFDTVKSEWYIVYIEGHRL